MRRALFALLMTAALAQSADLATSAANARVEAQRQLADARKAILAERAAASARLQGLQNRLAEVRAQQEDEGRAVKRIEDEARQSRQNQERDRLESDHLLALLENKAGVNAAKESLVDRLEMIDSAFKARAAGFGDRFAVRAGIEDISSRAGALARIPVVRVGAAAAALGEGRDQRGFLQPIADGWLVTGPVLPGSPARPTPGQIMRVPLDLSSTLTHAAEPEPFRLSAWMRAGGFFMWPIALVGLLGLAFVIERCSWFARMRSDGLLPRFLASAHDRSSVERLLDSLRTPLQRLLRAGLAAPPEAREAALERALLAEETRIQRGIGVLAVLAGVAPLLGLLGTVTGMIGMFATIAGHGAGNGQLLSGDISVALVTTQFGLIVAVPLMIAHALLSRVAEKRQAELEGAAHAVLDHG